MAFPAANKLTHVLLYQERNGSWRTGDLAYTRAEAKRLAVLATKRRGIRVAYTRVPASPA